MPFGKTDGTTEYLAKNKEQVMAHFFQTIDFFYLKKFKNFSKHHYAEAWAICDSYDVIYSLGSPVSNWANVENDFHSLVSHQIPASLTAYNHINQIHSLQQPQSR